jgi:hypothetical protein
VVSNWTSKDLVQNSKVDYLHPNRRRKCVKANSFGILV